MSYLAIYGAAYDANFQKRCQVALWRAAQDIAAEDPTTDGHEQRAEWAVRVLKDTVTIKPHVLAMQVLRNPGIAEAPTTAPDGDIQYQVNSVLDYIIAIG